ncbi:MAG: 3-deoxy-D-manno-octulosonic acid transferase [Alloprevotella sp.]|nr:3-deoxy-D-manno-octulosonic acid transferase [Alloprevotella sp.]
MYRLITATYFLCLRLAALFGHKKARLMVRGSEEAWAKIAAAFTADDQPVWFHAASLGEFEQGRPLMERLRREQPTRKILLTFFSPSGYEVMKDYDMADCVCYLPFDAPRRARRFVETVRPAAAFFIKYEFWAYYLQALHKQGVPTYSVSSIFRKDQIFFRPWGHSYRRALRCITHFFVQNEESCQLLGSIGITACSVAGDTRFARVVQIRNEAEPLPIAEQFAAGHDVLVCGSTWPPDEALLSSFAASHRDVRLIVVPHVVSEEHIEQIVGRFEGRTCVRYTKTSAEAAAQADVLIIDCYRLLSRLYRYATVCYVGGGFGVSIHNVTEAAVYARPVLFGPNNKKFLEAQELMRRKACFEVNNQEELNATLEHLLTDRTALHTAGQAAGAYIEEGARAADAIYEATMKEK